MNTSSMQVDRLRSCADLYDGTTKPEMAKELQRPYLAQELREAADTIWELREDLQRANAENGRLRELVREADRIMQGVLDNATDTVIVSDLPCCDTLFDNLCDYRLKMRMLGLELSDAQLKELRELGVEL